MSIQTATDLILDVVKAADPAVARQAEAMLEAASIRRSEQAAKTPAFETQLLASADPNAVPAAARPPMTPDQKIESYRKFEAMVLQSFIGSMLPKDSEQLYGKGTAGEIWKGMMAEQLGAALAQGGGIGIAEQLLGDRFGVGLRPESADALGSNVSNRAASLVDEVQKRIFAGISGSGEPVEDDAASARRT